MPITTPPSPHIEGRGVTYAFLERLTDARITPELKARCMAGSLAYYTQAVARTQRELNEKAVEAAAREPEPEPEPETAQTETEPEPTQEPEPASAEGERQDKLEQRRLEQRLAQQRRDLEQRERAMPIDWHEERVAEAAARFEEAAKPWLTEIFAAYDADGDRLSQSEYVSYLQGIGAWGKGKYTGEKFADKWVEECARLISDPLKGVSWEGFQRKLYGEYRSEDIGADVAAVRKQQSQGREAAAEADVTQATVTGQHAAAPAQDAERQDQLEMRLHQLEQRELEMRLAQDLPAGLG